MHKEILKKGLSLTIAIIFAVSNVLWAAPVDKAEFIQQSHLRPFSAAESPRVTQDIAGRLKESSVTGISRNDSQEVKEAQDELKSAREALLPIAQELVDFLADKDGTWMKRGVGAPDFSQANVENYNPLILAVGSPSPQAFANAARQWHIYKRWWGIDIPVVTSTGRGRGYKSFVLNTLRFFEEEDSKHGTHHAERFKQEYGPEIRRAQILSADSLFNEYNYYVGDRSKLSDKLTEAKVIKFIFMAYGVPEEAIYLEEISNQTRANMEQSYDVIKNDVVPKFEDPDKKLKIHVVADTFHRLRALLSGLQVFVHERSERNWEINAKAFYLPDFKKMDDEQLLAYLQHMIGKPQPDDTDGEIERFAKYGLTVYPESTCIGEHISENWDEAKINNLRNNLLRRYRDAKRRLDLLTGGKISSPAGVDIDTSDLDTVYVATGGGDCPGLSDAVAWLIKLFGIDNAQIVGIRNAFKGAAAEDFEAQKIPTNPDDSERLMGLGSTPFGSSREDPFKKGNEGKANQLIRNLAGALITDNGEEATIEDILEGTLLSTSGNEYDMGYILQASTKDLGAGFLTDKNGQKYDASDVDDAEVITKKGKIIGMRKPFKGLVITGGDDHLGIAWKLHLIGIRPVVVIPKSADRDFRTQMTGYHTASIRAARREVWDAMATGLTHNRVTVAELFGRGTGHFAFGAFQTKPEDFAQLPKDIRYSIERGAPVMIGLLPDAPTSLESIFRRIIDVVLSGELGSAMVAASEGFPIANDDPILWKLLELDPELKAKFFKVKEVDAFGNPKLEGVRHYILGLIRHASDIAEFIGDEELIKKIEQAKAYLKSPREVVITFETRGGPADDYDAAFVKGCAELAYGLINQGKSGLVITLREGLDPTKIENFNPQPIAPVVALETVAEVVAQRLGYNLEGKDYITRQRIVQEHLPQIHEYLRKNGTFWKEHTPEDEVAQIKQMARLMLYSEDEDIRRRAHRALTEKAGGKIQQAVTNLINYRDNQYMQAVGSTGTVDVITPSEGLFTPGRDAYEAVKAAGKALIAVNIVGYNQMEGHMRAAMEQNAGIIFEVARSQLGYAIDEHKTVAYIREVAERIGFNNPLVLHGDHIQYSEALFDVKKILKEEYEKVNGKGSYDESMDIEQIDMKILEAVQQRLRENAEKERKVIEGYVERLVKAGFTSIAIDASTIYDEVAGNAVLAYYREKGTPAERLVAELEQGFELPLEWGAHFLWLNPDDEFDRERFESIKSKIVSDMRKRNREGHEIARVVDDMTAAFGILWKKAHEKDIPADGVIEGYERIMREIADATIAGELSDIVRESMTDKQRLLLLPTSNAEETAHQIEHIDEFVEEYAPGLSGHFGKEIEVGHVDRKVPNPRRAGKLEPKMTHPFAVAVMGEYLESKDLSFDLIATNNGSSHGTDFDKQTLTPISQVGKISPWLTEELQKEAEEFDAAIAQHGTSGSDMEELADLAETGEIKFNIATNYQQIILNVLALLDDGLTPDEILQRSHSDTEALVNGLHERTREKIKQLAEAFQQDARAAELKAGDNLFVEFIKRAYAWGIKKGKIKETSSKEDIATVFAKEFKRVFCEMDEKLYPLAHLGQTEVTAGTKSFPAGSQSREVITQEAERMLEQIRRFTGLPIKTKAAELVYLAEKDGLFADWDDVFDYLASLEFTEPVHQIRDVDRLMDDGGEDKEKVFAGFVDEQGNAPVYAEVDEVADKVRGTKIVRAMQDVKPAKGVLKRSEVRRIQDLSVAMIGEDAISQTEGDARPAYFMQRGVFATRDDIRLAFETPLKQRFDITIMRPGVFGKEKELIHTSGHFHWPKQKPEIYQVVYGRAGYLLQRTDEPLEAEKVTNPANIKRAIMVEAEAGEPVVILPGYGHVTTNLSPNRPLVMVNWLTWDQSSQYGAFKRGAEDERGNIIGVGGGCWYATLKDGAIVYKPNPAFGPEEGKYHAIPNLEVVIPAPEVPLLGLRRGKPIYDIVKNEQMFTQLAGYLNEPLQDRFKDITPEKVFVPYYTRILAFGKRSSGTKSFPAGEEFEHALEENGIILPANITSGELLSMLYFADEKGHVPIIALDQGTLVVWANPYANKENPSQEDINAATRLRLTIVYYLSKGLREKGKSVGFLLDRPALEALNDTGAEQARVSNMIENNLLPSDFMEVVSNVSFVAQMEETRGKRGIVGDEFYTAARRDGFTVREAIGLGARMIKSNVFFYCGPELTEDEIAFNERQWQFMEELAAECRQSNIGYVSEILFMPPVAKKKEEKQYQQTREYLVAHAEATLATARRMRGIKGITLQKLAYPYPGEAAMNEELISEQERLAMLKQLSEIVPQGWIILSAAESWDTFHKKVLEAAQYGLVAGMLVGRTPIKNITQKVTDQAGKTVDAIRPYEQVIEVLQAEAIEKLLTLLGYIEQAPTSIWSGLGLTQEQVQLVPAVRTKYFTDTESFPAGTKSFPAGETPTGPFYPLSISTSDTEVEMGRKAAEDVFKAFKFLLDENRREGKDYVVMNFAAAPSQNAFLESFVTIVKQAGMKDHGDESYYAQRIIGVHLDEYEGIPADHPASFKTYLQRHLVDKLNLRDFLFLSDYDSDAYMEQISNLGGIGITCCGMGENTHVGFNDPPADFEATGIIKVKLARECRVQQVHDYPDMYNPEGLPLYAEDGNEIKENMEKVLENVSQFARTMAVRTMLEAKAIFVIVPGPRKAEAVKALLSPFDVGLNPNVPASYLKICPNVMLYLDRNSEAGIRDLLSNLPPSGIKSFPAGEESDEGQTMLDTLKKLLEETSELQIQSIPDIKAAISAYEAVVSIAEDTRFPRMTTLINEIKERATIQREFLAAILSLAEQIKGTPPATVFVDADLVPEDQMEFLAKLLLTDDGKPSELEKELGCRIVITKEFGDNVKGAENPIIVSNQVRLKGIKHLLVNLSTIKGHYMPVIPLIALAKAVVSLKDLNQQQDLAQSIVDFCSLLHINMDLEKLRDYLVSNLLHIVLPTPKPFDKEVLENLHRQILQALIAA